MTKYISVPGGQVADVFVVFCGSAYSASADRLSIRAYIGGVQAAPGIELVPLVTTYRNQCTMFQRLNVPAGTPAVKVQWKMNSLDAWMAERNVLVIANLH
jgi:hypothetical protein